MADVLTLTTQQDQALSLRKVDAEHDLWQIADLIEVCFGEQMDEDGQEYLRQIRRAAKDSRQIVWVRGSNEWVAMPMHGYVYMDGDRIIGNVTLVPFQKSGKWVYLVCNVAVHPDYRRNGIGRLLTQRGMEHIQKQKAQAAWLQVRDDNSPAIHMYETLGFQRRAVRSLWRAGSGEPFWKEYPKIEIRPRKREEWHQQLEWLESTYPPDVAWNLPFRSDTFKPSFWGQLKNYFQDIQVENWSARLGGQLVGTISWAESTFHQEVFWPVVSSVNDEDTLAALLVHMRLRMRSHRSMVVNYPAGQGEEGFEKAGFRKINTLIWMEISFA